jgi:Ca2+-binding RTX toxin-like protein
MANFFGTAGADSITATGSVGFGGGVLGPTGSDTVFGSGGDDTVIGNADNGSIFFVSGDDGNDSIAAR